MTLAEFLDLPETVGTRHELRQGVLYILAQPIPDHQQLTKWLSRHLSEQIEDTGAGYVFLPIDVVLSDDVAVAPDITVVRSERTEIIGQARLNGTPDIVVEVLSSDRNRDVVQKRILYEQAGVPEYWMLNGDADTLTALEIGEGGTYSERAVLTAADTLTTPLFPEFSLPLARLFDHPARIRPQE